MLQYTFSKAIDREVLDALYIYYNYNVT
jgi:hypothetical protein